MGTLETKPEEKSQQAAFWAKAHRTRTGCWPWHGKMHPDGYGQTGIAGLPRFAHRASWVLSFGPIPAGLVVMHSCDNRRCVNPAHLSLGTHSENARDRMVKGRSHQSASGGKLGRLRRRMQAEGLTQDQVATEAGVSRTHVNHVLHGRATSRKVVETAERLLASPENGSLAAPEAIHA